MAIKQKHYIYGQSPNPKTWHESAELLRSLRGHKVRKSEDYLINRLSDLNKILKEQGHK